MTQDSLIQNFEMNKFTQKLKDLLLKETLDSHTVNIAKNTNVYVIGDKDDIVYFIESGQIKLVMFSPGGKECIFAVYGVGGIFGELSVRKRLETATAMIDTQLKEVSYTKFLAHLGKELLLEDFVKYLAVRAIEQEQVIAGLVIVDNERRLGTILLHLVKSIGKSNAHGTVIHISYEELSKMIGMSRPRISFFMQKFCNLGFVTKMAEERYVIEEQKLFNYLAQIA